MIKRIVLNKVATFKEKAEINPRKVNFLYGSNGSGKTSLSKVLSNPKVYPESVVELDELSESETLVYNKDFVDMNFDETSKVKGIFTLGKEANEANEKIIEKELLSNKIKEEIIDKSKKINAIESSLKANKEEFIEFTWKFRGTYGKIFSQVFAGHLSSKEKFMEYCLTLKDKVSKNDKIIKSFDHLELDYTKFYSNTPEQVDELKIIDFEKTIIDHPGHKIMQESIKGNEELEISKLINKLDNSEWVFEGLKHSHNSGDKCPFCQQDINDKIISSLRELFNDEYTKKLDKIRSYYELIREITLKMEGYSEEVTVKYSSNFDITRLSLSFERVKKILGTLLLDINNKLIKPSEVYVTPDFSDFRNLGKELSTLANNIKEWNAKVVGIKAEKENIKNTILANLSNEIDDVRNRYIKKNDGLIKSKKQFEDEILELKSNLKELSQEIQVIRTEMSGISNSINEINSLLNKFGFTGFLLKEYDEYHYEIVRPDGTIVGRTLSEGEQRFISFLYFYQLIKGTHDSSGLKKDRIIVIDDPISSLDSNILFIVSTLTKNLINDCLRNKNGIRQIFILTHNVYFYGEVTFKPARIEKEIAFKKTNTLYGIVKKHSNTSSLREFDENPIKTLYQLLWDEIKDLEDSKGVNGKSVVFNTMRRILEYYFNIIGELKYDELIEKFKDDEQKELATSLISVINQNSHGITDDFSIIMDEEMVAKYANVFKEIFILTGHESHYNMMMKIEA